jgi:xanthine dehydrogenase iron-sulfur cluster and FAD-binding subunit A
VLIDGVRTNSCLKLAVTLDGREITTVEGLGQPSNLHPHQTASVEHDPFQCGYCSPGQICSARVMNIASIGGSVGVGGAGAYRSYARIGGSGVPRLCKNLIRR